MVYNTYMDNERHDCEREIPQWRSLFGGETSKLSKLSYSRKQRGIAEKA